MAAAIAIPDVRDTAYNGYAYDKDKCETLAQWEWRVANIAC